jgi:hypothetical protein
MVLGLEPSRLRVLLNAASTLSKLSLILAAEAYPAVMFEMGVILTIIVEYLLL